MQSYLNKFKLSKYRIFVKGLFFAIVALVALILCVFSLMDKTSSIYLVLFHFTIVLLSMFMGFITMFKPYKTQEALLNYRT